MHDLSRDGDNRVCAIEGPIAVTFRRSRPDQLGAGPASEGSIGGRRAPGTPECDGVATATAKREIERRSMGRSKRCGDRCDRGLVQPTHSNGRYVLASDRMTSAIVLGGVGAGIGALIGWAIDKAR
jgi:hypothetical protein